MHPLSCLIKLKANSPFSHVNSAKLHRNKSFSIGQKFFSCLKPFYYSTKAVTDWHLVYNLNTHSNYGQLRAFSHSALWGRRECANRGCNLKVGSEIIVHQMSNSYTLYAVEQHWIIQEWVFLSQYASTGISNYPSRRNHNNLYTLWHKSPQILCIFLPVKWI